MAAFNLSFILPILLRKVFPIALLFFIGFSQTGYHIFSVCYRLYLKEEMREAIIHMADRKDLTCISYTDHESEIEWEEKGKEFSFQDKMFDVAFADTVNGKILLYCADDSKETALAAKYKANNKDNPSSSRKSTALSLKATDLFCAANTTASQSFSLERSYFLKYNCIPLAGITNISSPPPKTLA